MEKHKTLIGVGVGVAALAALYFTVGKPWLAKRRGEAASIRSVAAAVRASAPKTTLRIRTASGTKEVDQREDRAAEIKAQAAAGGFKNASQSFTGVFG